MIAQLTDKGLSVLVFAAYHTLTSGEVVRKVVLDDGKGHQADADGVQEMIDAGLLEEQGERGRLTDKGEQALAELLELIRGGGRAG
jgi:hypothetical protein